MVGLAPETQAELEVFRQQWRDEVIARNRREDDNKDLRESHRRRDNVPLLSSSDAGPSTTARQKEATDYSEEVEPRTYHDLPDKEEQLKLGVEGQDHDRDVDREPKSALEHYERAVDKETRGQLGDSMRHYRIAFKVGHYHIYITATLRAFASIYHPASHSFLSLPLTFIRQRAFVLR